MIQNINRNVQNMQFHLGQNRPNPIHWDLAWAEVAAVSESRIFGMKKYILKPEQITPRWKKCLFSPDISLVPHSLLVVTRLGSMDTRVGEVVHSLLSWKA